MTLYYIKYYRFLCLLVNQGFVDALMFLDLWS